MYNYKLGIIKAYNEEIGLNLEGPGKTRERKRME